MDARRIAGWILVITGSALALWGAAAVGVATLGTLRMAFREESMAGLGFLFGTPGLLVGGLLLGIGLSMVRSRA